MKTLDSFFKGLSLALRWLCLILMVGMSLMVFLKVIFRYVIQNPIVWSDEAIMLTLLSLTYFGAALAAENRGHINVDLLESVLAKLSPKALRAWRLILDVVTLTVLGIVTVFGFKICLFSRDQVTDVIMLSYFWVYLILPVGLFVFILMILKRLYHEWLNPGNG
jgi:TRAP-type C4-dicarboxylate transport system permease small subunit